MMFVLRLLALLLLVVLSTAPPAVAQRAPDSDTLRALRGEVLFVRGLTELQLGNPAAATAALEEALRLMPGEPDVLAALAEALMAEGNDSRALFYASQALAQRPGEAEYAYQVGSLHLLAGRIDSAVQTYRTLLAHRPDDTTVRIVLADVLETVGRHHEAVATLQDVGDLEALGPDGLERLMRLYDGLGEQDRALAVHLKLADVQPHDDDLRVRLVRRYLARGDEDAARDLLASLSEASLVNEDVSSLLGLVAPNDAEYAPAPPNELEARLHRLVASLSDAPLENAAQRQEFESLVERLPPSAQSRLLRASFELAAGEYGPAARLALNLLNQEPTNRDAWLIALSALEAAGDFRRAYEMGDEAVLLFPGDVAVISASARAALSAGRAAEARAWLARVPEARASELLLLIETADMLADEEAASSLLSQALADEAASWRAQALASRLLTSRGEHASQALQLANLATRNAPTQPVALGALGFVKLRSGQIEDAASTLERALAAGPAPAVERARIILWLSEAEEARYNPTRARELREQAVGLWPLVESSGRP